jgi:hypothetical protein
MICICVRRTLDWGNKAAVDAGLIETFRPKVELWNATFTIPYHEFRQRLKSIAELSLDRVEGAQRASVEAAPPGALLVPVDDDDWFSPDLANRLREEFDPSISCYYWSRHILEPGRHVRRFKGLLKEFLTGEVIFATNNYAIRNIGDLASVTGPHMQAWRHFQATPEQVKYLPAALSIHNRSLASQTTLGMGRQSLSRDQLIERFDRYRTLYAKTHLWWRLRWAAPYVALMSELMDALKPR